MENRDFRRGNGNAQSSGWRTMRLLPWLVALASTVSALLVAELLLRTLRPQAQRVFLLQSHHESERGKFCVYDPTLGWAGKPNVDDTFDIFDCHHRVHQNRYGFRGPAVDFERTGARRLVVLGDSFVWGLGVEDDEIFTSRLARESSPPIEVVNLGVSGYGTDQEFLLWKQLGQRFQPDVVLLVVTPWTDLYDNLYSERYGYPKPLFRWNDTNSDLVLTNLPVPRRPGPWDLDDATEQTVPRAPLFRLISRSALVSGGLLALARVPHLLDAMERDGIISPRMAGQPWEDRFFEPSPDSETTDGWALLGHLLTALADSVRQAGSELVVVIAPSNVQVYPELWAEFARAHPRPPGNPLDPELPTRFLTDLCYELHLRVIDLQPPLQAAAHNEPYLYYRWNLHWTAAGHRVVADVLRRELAQP
jgi:hypothetical protein